MLRQVGKVLLEHHAVRAAGHLLRGGVRLRKVVFRRFAQLLHGVLLHLEAEPLLHGRGEVIQTPDRHEDKGGAADEFHHACQPEQKARPLQRKDERNNQPDGQRADRQLPHGDGNGRGQPGEKRKNFAGDFRIKGKKRLRPFLCRKHQRSQQEQKGAGGDQTAKGLDHGIPSFFYSSARKSATPVSRTDMSKSKSGVCSGLPPVPRKKKTPGTRRWNSEKSSVVKVGCASSMG